MVEEEKAQEDVMEEVPTPSNVAVSEFLPPDAETTAKVKVIASDHVGCSTYEIRSESHTMGNSLRWALSKNKKVNFCGYTIPHPSENALHLRVQTVAVDDVAAAEVMEDSFDTLEKIFHHMIATYETSVRSYMKLDEAADGDEHDGDGEEMKDD
jgi:DNA-directed RNA polymerase I and III subunit RPAC2